MEINIGDLDLLTFIDDLSEENQLKAIFSLDFNGKEKIIDKLEKIESKVWIQIGGNQRIFGDIILNNSFSDDDESYKWVLKFELSSLMTKELISGETLFAGVEHQSYNVRTQEIPLSISKLLAEIINK